MKRYILFIFFLVTSGLVHGQCLTSSLVINTGYNPITGTAIAGGANGATPVPDPHWVVTAESPGVATAIAGTPIIGLVEVVPGNKADIITPVSGPWITNPAANPGNWISCLNSNTYTDPGTGILLNMTLGRPFRMCSDDNITFSFYIASDNLTTAANIDGTTVLPAPTSAYGSYTLYTQTVFLTAGTHTINIVVNNQNVATSSSNPTGLNVYGTIFSATGLNSLVSESYASCSTYACGSTCNTITLPDTLHLCEHTSDTLRAAIVGTDSIFSISWSPATGLSSTTVVRPLLTVGTTSGWYDITVQALTPYNLVYNGNFSLGNTGFTSTYTYVTGPGSLGPEGTYAITTSPSLVHSGTASFGDHTTGTGNMMAINGSGTPTSVWCQTIPVTPNTNYTFSAWVANWSTPGAGEAPILQFMINGVLIGTPLTVTSAVGTWIHFYATWNSGANTTASICVYDECTSLSGNDFALDDIFFQQICVAKDSIYADVALIDTTYRHVNDSVCAPITTVTLTAPGGYASYLWNTASTASSISVTAVGNYWVYAPSTCAMLIDTFIVSIAHVDTTATHADSSACASAASITLVAPAGYSSYLWNTGSTSSSISVTTAGTYLVYAPGACTMLVDTFHVLFNPLPVVNLGNDTAFCSGHTVVLSSVQPAGTTYQWSTGATTDTIHVSATGTYWLHVHNGCDATDSINITVNPLPVVGLGPDTMNCQGNPVILQSVVTYPAGTTYLWNTGATTSSITAVTTGTYWLQVNSNSGCSESDTINISILYDTVKLHTTDTAICKGQSVQVITTGNPINTYQWLPTTGIANSTAGSPVIFGDTSAMYVMTAHFPGCPDIIDSFYLDVQPDPINVYIGGNRAVCEYDTLHLHASVTPAWYTHYMYSWTPTTFLDYPTMPNVVFTAGDSTTIVLTVTTSAGCTGEDSAKIAVHPGDFAHVDSLYNVCPRDSVQFKPTGGVSYQWIPSMYIDSPGLSIAPWVHPITSQHYTMIAMSQYGCMDTLSLYVSVQPAAAIYLGDSVTIYPGESYQITPQTNCTSFSWSPSSGLNDAYIANPTAMPDVNTIYVVTASTESGCVTKDSIAIYVSPETLLALPNAFTPGNGPNNLFKIIKRGVATLNYFRVFNRWGNMVYESSNIDDGWDGSYKGKPQPYDVYIYEVEAKTELGRTFHMHGNVTLMR